MARGEQITLLLTQRAGIARQLHRLDDGSTCIVFGVDFLRRARHLRSTALVAGAADDANALTTLAAAADNPTALADLIRGSQWREQVEALTGMQALDYVPRVLHMANQALSRLPAEAELNDEQFELLSSLFSALVAQAARQGSTGRVVDLLNGDEKAGMEWVRRNPGVAEHLIRHEFSERDVVSLAYRREQLTRFRRLLDDVAYFEAEKVRLELRGDESLWQKFFEANPWIFGMSLRLVLMSKFHEPSLEAVTTGATFEEAGKRVDALMKTIGTVQSLCFIEIKTHTTKLMHRPAYRGECWAPSAELAGGVAQVQKTVQKAMVRVRSEPRHAEGYRLDQAFMFQPKAYVVIGSLTEFERDNEINEPQFGSFELYRRNLLNPEIITFDELLARATALLDHEETRQRA